MTFAPVAYSQGSQYPRNGQPSGIHKELPRAFWQLQELDRKHRGRGSSQKGTSILLNIKYSIGASFVLVRRGFRGFC